MHHFDSLSCFQMQQVKSYGQYTNSRLTQEIGCKATVTKIYSNDTSVKAHNAMKHVYFIEYNLIKT